MGDRGNIVIEKDTDCFPAPVVFYSHWDGSSLKLRLQAALKRGRGRWSDPSYLARIIFSEMIQRAVLDETGYGISTTVGDGEHPLICVNIAEQKVRIRDSDDDLNAKVLQEWTFKEYITLPSAILA